MKKIIHAVNAQQLSKTAQKEVKGAQAAAAVNRFLCLGDYSCFATSNACYAYCIFEYGSKCRITSFECA